MTNLKVGKTYKTREGRIARILATDRDGDFPVVGLIDNREIITWTFKGLSGWLSGERRHDLMIEPDRKSRWINWYVTGSGVDYGTREEADENAVDDRTHVLEIITEDGKPVDVKIHEVER